MIWFASVCAATTAIAIISAASGSRPRSLPWIGGVLLGIGMFWVLPEIALDGGWLRIAAVLVTVVLLGLIDRYIYPICPFCAAGAVCEQTVRVGWPLLAVASLHSFMDGWTIGLVQAFQHSYSAMALSLGTTVHKVPESVAIGLLSGRLAPSRKAALGIIALLQIAMAAGGVLSFSTGRIDINWAGISVVPAAAFLLLFGALALEQEWRLHGKLSAARATAPGVLCCGFAALAMKVLWR